MGDILQRVADLEEFYEQQQKLTKDLLKMFELSGYSMNTEEVEGKARPKELRELVEEVLGNPPEEPQRWIRIQDIPRFIDDYLMYPDRQTTDAFNDRSSTLKPGHPQLVVKTIEPKEPEEEVTVNDQGVLDPKLEYTSQEWPKAGMVPVGTVIQDEIGAVMKKVGPNQWIDVYSYDEEAPDFSYDADVTAFAPLKGVKLKGS